MSELKNTTTAIKKNRETVLATAAGGICIALSTALSFIKPFEMPQGGSITPASMLPILFFALAFGPAWGIGVGAVYGLLQFILQPFAAHWASIILDYPLAFGLLGLAGLMAAAKQRRMAESNILRRLSLIPFWQVLTAVVIGIAGRFLAHVVSGVVFYAEYAEGQNVWIYSLTYNMTYILPEAVIDVAVLLIMSGILHLYKKPAVKTNP